MFEVKGGDVAYVYDLDDTVIDRGVITRVGSMLNARFPLIHHHEPIPSLDAVPVLDRQIIEVPITNPAEWIFFQLHAGRHVFPEMEETLAKNASNGGDIYGVTGRYARRVWVDMTMQTLDQGHIGLYFQGISFKPFGVSGTLSKLEALRRIWEAYKEVRYFEDDKRTLKVVKDRDTGNNR